MKQIKSIDSPTLETQLTAEQLQKGITPMSAVQSALYDANTLDILSDWLDWAELGQGFYFLKKGRSCNAFVTMANALRKNFCYHERMYKLEGGIGKNPICYNTVMQTIWQEQFHGAVFKDPEARKCLHGQKQEEMLKGLVEVFDACRDSVLLRKGDSGQISGADVDAFLSEARKVKLEIAKLLIVWEPMSKSEYVDEGLQQSVPMIIQYGYEQLGRGVLGVSGSQNSNRKRKASRAGVRRKAQVLFNSAAEEGMESDPLSTKENLSLTNARKALFVTGEAAAEQQQHKENEQYARLVARIEECVGTSQWHINKFSGRMSSENLSKRKDKNFAAIHVDTDDELQECILINNEESVEGCVVGVASMSILSASASQGAEMAP